MKTLRVAIYTRVSTEKQSNVMQLTDLNAYAARSEMTNITYYNDKLSGAISSRPGLDQMFDDVRKRKIDVILVWRFDRFARSTVFLLKSLEEFKTLGVRFISYQENIDTNTPMGQAMFSIISTIAQLERDITRERVTAGMRVARENGKTLGRPHAITYERVMELKAQKMSIRKIAKEGKTSTTSVQRALKRGA